jgi:hypothetical protein
MMIRFVQRVTVTEFLSAMKQRYGDLEGFRSYVRRHPRNVAARLDLEDFEFYKDRPDLRSEAMERAVSLIPVTTEALSMFTRQRLALLETLARGTFDSVRQLAGHLGRDVHNVHEDLQLFRKLGIVAFERGPRNRRIPKLVADSINVIAGRAPLERFSTHAGAKPFAPADESHEP